MTITLENETQVATLRQFQDQVADLEQDEHTCFRFLKARSFNLERAETMLRNCVNWRKETDIDAIAKLEKPEYIEKHFPYHFTGQSNIGGPVLWVPFGKWNIRHWVDQGKTEELHTYSLHLLEVSLKKIKAAGNKPMVAIYDLEGLNYYKATHLESCKLVYMMFQVLESNYPEILQNIVLFNSPWVFHTAFSMMKPVISSQTMEKILVFGSDKNKYLPALHKLIPKDSFVSEFL